MHLCVCWAGRKSGLLAFPAMPSSHLHRFRCTPPPPPFAFLPTPALCVSLVPPPLPFAQYQTLLEKHKALNHERNELDMELRALEEADMAAARDEQQLQAKVDRANAELGALDSELTEQLVRF